MAKSRKDNKGRVLRKGESYRSSDGKYQYAYADEAGKRRYIYSKNLTTLRQREEQILRDKLDGIDSGQAKNQTLNDIFDSTWQHGKIWRKGLLQDICISIMHMSGKA